MRFTDEQIAALKAANKEVQLHLVSACDEDFIVRAPNRTEWQSFKAAAQDPARKRVAPENFAKACAISPDASALDTLFETMPGLAETMAGELAEIAGVDQKASHRRL
jgi:hypothetical protein